MQLRQAAHTKHSFHAEQGFGRAELVFRGSEEGPCSTTAGGGRKPGRKNLSKVKGCW